MIHAAVSLQDTTKKFGERESVAGLTLSVAEGTVFGLLGPNGAGKTTTINLVTGMLAADSGQVRVGGFDPVTQARQVRPLIGLVTQDTSLYPELSGRENLRFHAALYLTSLRGARARIDEILDLVELRERAGDAVGTYSGGMRRRLAIGRALLHRPRVLLLGEPTLGVDVQGRYRIWDYVRALGEQLITVIVTTNDMAEADYLCDELAIIDHGKLVVQGSPSNLKDEAEAETLGAVFLANTGRALRDTGR